MFYRSPRSGAKVLLFVIVVAMVGTGRPVCGRAIFFVSFCQERASARARLHGRGLSRTNNAISGLSQPRLFDRSPRRGSRTSADTTLPAVALKPWSVEETGPCSFRARRQRDKRSPTPIVRMSREGGRQPSSGRAMRPRRIAANIGKLPDCCPSAKNH